MKNKIVVLLMMVLVLGGCVSQPDENKFYEEYVMSESDYLIADNILFSGFEKHNTGITFLSRSNYSYGVATYKYFNPAKEKFLEAEEKFKKNKETLIKLKKLAPTDFFRVYIENKIQLAETKQKVSNLYYNYSILNLKLLSDVNYGYIESYNYNVTEQLNKQNIVYDEIIITHTKIENINKKIEEHWNTLGINKEVK